MDPSRRGVLGVSLFTATLAVPEWRDVVGRMEGVRSGRTPRFGAADVDGVAAVADRLSELDDQYGGRHVRPMAAGFLVNTVAPYLRAPASEPVRKAMMSAASDLCYLTGHMAAGEKLDGLAQQYYVKSLELAGAAEDDVRYCTTMRGMSVQAVDLGHGARAARLADAAADMSSGGEPRMRAFVAGQQAHCAAKAGERRKALAYLGEAETAMDKAGPRTRTFGYYTPAALMYHVSQVRYELGDLHGSVAAMQESDRLRDHVRDRRTRMRFLCLLAERQLQIGHLDAACATWHQALDDYPHVQSGLCDERVADLRARVRPHLANPAARHLHERARALAA